MIGPLASLAASFTWCAGSNVYSRLAKDFYPSQISFTRAAVSLPLFLLSAFIFDQFSAAEVLNRLASGNGFWLFLSMIASYGVGDMFFFWSTRSLGLPGALAIASSYPFWSAMAGVMFESHSLSAMKWAGIACTILGTVTVVLVGYHYRQKKVSAFLDRFEVGVLFGFLTSLCWSLNTFSVARGTVGLSPHVTNSVRMIIALVLCPIIGFLVTRRWYGGISIRRLMPLSWAFILEAYGGAFCFVYGFSHTPLAVASALSSLAPVIAVPVAWMSRQESVSMLKAFGVCLAVAGAILLVMP